MAPKGQGAFGRGRGMGGGRSMGLGGDCVCPNCGETVPRMSGNACFDINCPKCGVAMTMA